MSGEAYKGLSRRLVLAFDVGTTYSGISFCILDPGSVPKICSITRYPGQEHIAGSSKIPSVVYYDKDGNVKAVGAEAELDHIVEEADEEGWSKVQWFKLRLRPKSLSSLPLKHLSPLPRNKSATDVMADFLRYMMACAENFIKDTQPTYISTWDKLRAKAAFVVAHPNGWEGAQQARYRRAAVQAGLVPDTQEGRSRIIFVTEGEASLHFCLKGDHMSNLSTNNGFIVADLGGGTLDFSAYRPTEFDPLRVEEMASSRCELQGGSFVTERANAYVKNKLRFSRYGNPSIVGEIVNAFDRHAKRLFRGATERVCYLKFGTQTDRDLEHDIRAGRLHIQAEHVEKFFEPSIDAAENAILGQIRESPVNVTAVYLVGGFAASPYLVSQIRERLSGRNIAVHVPDGQTSKAVAEGSISFYIEHHVVARIVKTTYLSFVGVPYNPSDPEHRKRISTVYKAADGRDYVGCGISVILPRGTTVKEETEFSITTCSINLVSSGINHHDSIPLYRYCGSVTELQWIDEMEPASLSIACRIRFPESDYSNAISSGMNPSGDVYTRLTYRIVMKFGGPEVQAQIAWRGRYGEERSPAEIVYDFNDGVDNNDVCDDDGADDISNYGRELNSVTWSMNQTKLDESTWAWMT